VTSRQWGLWLFAAAAGAGIALSAGQGTAAADTGDTARTDTTVTGSVSRPADTERPSRAEQREANRERIRENIRERRAERAERREERLATRRQRTETGTETDTETEARPWKRLVAKDTGTAEESTVSGVKTGHAALDIPVGDRDLKTRADWYFPTQADGSVTATGVVYLQHGFMGRKFFYSALAKNLSQTTNSIVVVPNLPSFPSLRCGGCWINGTDTQQAVADLFLGDESQLGSSAAAAGFTGVLPEDFVLTGHSAGGGLAAAAGGYYTEDPDNGGHLRGVVMFDGFAFSGVLPDAVARLDAADIPIYQIAAPPQAGNLFGAATAELVAARPGRFVGVTLAGGSHVDSLIGGNPISDLLSQLTTRFSPPGNTAAVYTLASGWINDLYRGLGPADGTGIYGAPDQYLVLGDASAVVLAPPPTVDVPSYLGTWFEVGSVKQFFSLGLVNTEAEYSLNPDGSIKVRNSGNYFVDNGPQSTIEGVALPVDPADNKLNVTFFGTPKADPPGNYWIVDLDPDYQWAIVTDPSGKTGFLLSRTPTVSDAFYQELLDRASVYGVRARITPTRQPQAGVTTAL
jgi:lipocalin